MKLTKNELKQIIKECLIEILTESPTTNHVNESKVKAHSTKQTSPMIRNAVQKNPPKFNSPIKTGDPILDSVIADTAKTTLPVMLEAENRKVPVNQGTAERVVAATPPENLFGEDTAAKWAALAFNDFSK